MSAGFQESAGQHVYCSLRCRERCPRFPNDDEYVDNTPVAARITAGIGNSVSSRAAGTAWAKGDKIGITTLRGDESKYVNMEYTTENGDGKFAGTPMYFQDAQAEVTFTAYYPFTGTEGTAPDIVESTYSSSLVQAASASVAAAKSKNFFIRFSIRYI